MPGLQPSGRLATNLQLQEKCAGGVEGKIPKVEPSPLTQVVAYHAHAHDLDP